MRWLRRRDVARSQEEETAVEPSTPVKVTGTTGRDGRVVQEPSETVVDGVVEIRDFVIEWGPLELDDPRLAGTVTVALNANVHKQRDSVEIVPQTLAIRIENEAGSWSGHGTSLSHGRGAIPPEEATNLDTILLTGAGAYSGLTAYLIVDGTREPPTVEGAIVAGGMPPYPDLPST